MQPCDDPVHLLRYLERNRVGIDDAARALYTSPPPLPRVTYETAVEFQITVP